MINIDNLLQKIESRVQDLTELKIQTVMGKLVIDNDKQIEFVPGQEIEGIISKIDLLDGDITTQITEKFYQKYPELVQFHQSREAKGHEIIENNILALTSIVTAIREMI